MDRTALLIWVFIAYNAWIAACVLAVLMSPILTQRQLPTPVLVGWGIVFTLALGQIVFLWGLRYLI